MLYCNFTFVELIILYLFFIFQYWLAIRMLWHKSDMSTAEQSQKVVTAHFPSNRLLRFGFARQGSTWPELVAPLHSPSSLRRCSNTKRWINADLMVAHRLRRWATINPTLVFCLLVGVVASRNRRYGLSSGQSVQMCRTPASMSRGSNVGLMLVQRRRLWANISPALVQRLLFARSPPCQLSSKGI